MRLLRRKQIGTLIVFERERGYETWMPLYVVGHVDGRMLEEFRRYRAAVKWSEKNKGRMKG